MDKRSPDDFSPIEQLTVAEEIVPLVQALNRLFGRIGESFRREREFTDYAAHELRTPLAAMKTQTQVLQKKRTACLNLPIVSKLAGLDRSRDPARRAAFIAVPYSKRRISEIGRQPFRVPV